METYEKKYKELEGKIKKAYLYAQTDSTKAVLEEILPELKDNDERIRKALITYFQRFPYPYGGIESAGTNAKEALAWLEKQETSYTKKDINDAYLKGITDAKNEIEKQHEANYQIRKDIATFIFNYRGDIKDRAKWMDYLDVKVSFVEKQDNQKPQGKTALEALKEEKVDNANKVELKFHEGDWIVFKDKYYKVNYNGCGYDLIDQNGLHILLEYETIDENAHLWSIEEAKDGDILSNGTMVVIFKHFEEPAYRQHIVAYVGLDTLGDIQITDDTWQLGLDQAKPATKEQCDLLFNKITKAGCKFNNDTKKLEKIENNKL